MASSQPNGNTFTEKYQRYAPALYRISMMYLCNTADAEEVMQDAFVRLICRKKSFTDEAHEKKWLLRVTINLCKDRLKSYWHKKVTMFDPAQLPDMTDEEKTFASLIIHLPQPAKSVLYLYYYEGYHIQEISQILRISNSAVKMRLKRAREQLKLDLEEDNYG